MMCGAQEARFRSQKARLREAYQKDLNDSSSVASKLKLPWGTYQHAYSLVSPLPPTPPPPHPAPCTRASHQHLLSWSPMSPSCTVASLGCGGIISGGGCAAGDAALVLQRERDHNFWECHDGDRGGLGAHPGAPQRPPPPRPHTRGCCPAPSPATPELLIATPIIICGGYPS